MSKKEAVCAIVVVVVALMYTHVAANGLPKPLELTADNFDVETHGPTHLELENLLSRAPPSSSAGTGAETLQLSQNVLKCRQNHALCSEPLLVSVKNKCAGLKADSAPPPRPLLAFLS